MGDDIMNATTQVKTAESTAVSSQLASIVFVAIIGMGLLFTAGFANSATLHNATHDSRHSIGFPCH